MSDGQKPPPKDPRLSRPDDDEPTQIMMAPKPKIQRAAAGPMKAPAPRPAAGMPAVPSPPSSRGLPPPPNPSRPLAKPLPRPPVASPQSQPTTAIPKPDQLRVKPPVGLPSSGGNPMARTLAGPPPRVAPAAQPAAQPNKPIARTVPYPQQQARPEPKPPVASQPNPAPSVARRAPAPAATRPQPTSNRAPPPQRDAPLGTSAGSAGPQRDAPFGTSAGSAGPQRDAPFGTSAGSAGPQRDEPPPTLSPGSLPTMMQERARPASNRPAPNRPASHAPPRPASSRPPSSERTIMMVNAPVRPNLPPNTRVPSFPPPAMAQQSPSAYPPPQPYQPPQPLAYPPQQQQPWPNAPQQQPLGQQRPMTAPVAFQSPRAAPPNMQHAAYDNPFSPAAPPVYTPEPGPVQLSPHPPRVVTGHAPPPAPMSSRDLEASGSMAGERLSAGALVYMAAPLFFATAVVALLALR